jgi:hypothetical protein
MTLSSTIAILPLVSPTLEMSHTVGFSPDLVRNRDICRVSPDLEGGQALLRHWVRRDAAGAIVGDHTLPDFRHTCLLFRIVKNHTRLQVSAHSLALLAAARFRKHVLLYA